MKTFTQQNLKRVSIGLLTLSFFLSSCQEEAEPTLKATTSQTVQDEQVVMLNDANLVSLEEAEKIAASYLTGKEIAASYPTQAGATQDAQPKKIKSKHVESAENLPAYYVFNFENGGFAVVSADKRLMPLLAYSDKNHFDTERKVPGVMDWAVATKAQIADLRKSGAKQDAGLAELWRKYEASGTIMNLPPRDQGGDPDPDGEPCYYSVTGPLLNSTWGQGCGYNALLPEVIGAPCDKARAGCAPVAAGQIMRYHQWPSWYVWADMPPEFGTSETARLMFDLGQWSGTSYGTESSSTSREGIRMALGRAGYSTADVDYDYTIVAGEITRNRPVMLRACDGFFGTNCHIWVCDGLRKVTGGCYNGVYFHMNWGWDNDYDGWYAISDWSSKSNYNYHKGIITVVPNR